MKYQLLAKMQEGVRYSMKYEFTIGETSKILDLSIDTLRYYDKIGLLNPSIRGGNKYRFYTLEQMDTLVTIKMLRALDISIEDIIKLLSEKNIDNTRAVIRRKREEVSEQIRYYKLLNRKLDYFDAVFDKYGDADYIEIIKSPTYWMILTDSIMESDDRGLSKKIDRLLKSFSPRKEWITLCHSISIVSKENLLKGEYHSYLNNGIASTLQFAGADSPFEIFQSTLCAHKCIVIDDLNYEAINQHYDAMKIFIEKRNYEIAGNSLEISVFKQYNRHYMEVYIPVKEAGEISD